jgi:hypothetical protein
MYCPKSTYADVMLSGNLKCQQITAVPGGAFSSGTAPQAGRSRVRFLSGRSMALESTQPLSIRSTEGTSSEVKAAGVYV